MYKIKKDFGQHKANDIVDSNSEGGFCCANTGSGLQDYNPFKRIFFNDKTWFGSYIHTSLTDELKAKEKHPNWWYI